MIDTRTETVTVEGVPEDLPVDVKVELRFESKTEGEMVTEEHADEKYVEKEMVRERERTEKREVIDIDLIVRTVVENNMCDTVVSYFGLEYNNCKEALKVIAEKEPEMLRDVVCDFIEKENKELYVRVCEQGKDNVMVPPVPPVAEIMPLEEFTKIVVEKNACDVLVKVLSDEGTSVEVNTCTPEEVARVMSELSPRQLRKIMCDTLEYTDPEMYVLRCERKMPEVVPPIPKPVIKEGKVEVRTENTEELKRVIRELKETIRQLREEVKELRLKIRELRKKLMITTQGIVDPETGEVVEVDRAEIEVNIKNKPVKIKKEEREIYIETPSGVRVKVELPEVVVENNGLAVGRAKVSVLPDEVLEKIRHAVRVDQAEDVRLTVEGNKPVYDIKAKMRGRLLFFIPVELPVEVKVDAETGRELRVNMPFWAFLVVPS